MELENYEENLADIALQEQTFYETKPTLYELQMASQLMNGALTAQNGHSGTFNSPANFPLLPIINSSGKGKKKKSVKFLTYVQVSVVSCSTSTALLAMKSISCESAKHSTRRKFIILILGAFAPLVV
jgi:hypothetical protein